MNASKIAKCIFAGMLLLSAPTSASNAADKKNVAIPKKLEVTKSAAPLTEDECTHAGGTVVDFAECNSKKVCSLTDQNQVGHAVCISVKK